MFDQHANKVVTFEAAHLAAEAHENSRNSGEFRHKAGHAIATAERLQSSVSGPPKTGPPRMSWSRVVVGLSGVIWVRLPPSRLIASGTVPDL